MVTNRLPPPEVEPLETDESEGVWVKVGYTTGDTLYFFGPFTDRSLAEECVLILAGRADVESAEIEETDDD